MTAIVLPDIDKSTIDELRKKLPNLKEIELPAMPKMEEVGRSADQQIDRLLGRSKAPVWPWIAAGIGLVAVVGAVAAYFAFWRRPTWESSSDPWTTEPAAADDSVRVPSGATDVAGDSSGLTAAESSLTSTSYPPQEA